mgnify:FL=1
MRSLMKKASLSPPTFESDHTKNQFTTRILLHHFLNEEDIEWLKSFNDQSLSDGQKRGLILLREIGAIDNSSYRQLNGVDILRASQDLRSLREKDIVIQKGKGRATYYIPNNQLNQWQSFSDHNDGFWWDFDGFPDDFDPDLDFSAPVQSDFVDESVLSAPVPDNFDPNLELSAPVQFDFHDESALNAPVPDDFDPDIDLSTPVNESLVHQLPAKLQDEIRSLPLRVSNPLLVEELILKICEMKPYKISELAGILGKTDKYILRTFISPMKDKGMLEYQFPDMPNHPEQAYITKLKS